MKLSQLKDREVFDFPVEREKLVTPSGIDSMHDCIVRMDNQAPVGLVSRDYKMVTHTEAVEAVLEEMEKRRLGNVRPTTMTTSKGGSRMFASFVFGEESKVGTLIDPDSHLKIDDLVSPGFTILNSYDRTMRFFLKSFISRLVCINGLMIAEELFLRSHRHVQSLDVKEMVDDFLTQIEGIEKVLIPRIKRLVSADSTPQMIEAEINKMPGWVQGETLDYLVERELVELGEDEDGELEVHVVKKITQWELINAFTYVLTHSESAPSDRKLELSEQVSRQFLVAA